VLKSGQGDGRVPHPLPLVRVTRLRLFFIANFFASRDHVVNIVAGFEPPTRNRSTQLFTGDTVTLEKWGFNF
jgi:hypothetical protein